MTATVHPLRRLPRTEQEAMAAAVARLLDVGLLPRNAPTIRKAADSLGIPVDSIRDAWRELDGRLWVAPTTARCSRVVAAQPTDPHVASDLTHLCCMACLANWSACKAEAELR